MEKLKVIICGTGFGKFYLEAVRQLPDNYELVGIFSRGSQESRRYAQRFNVPLYTEISVLDQIEIDVACVVIKSAIVGGKGTEIALHFLHRGIHVLQEHPIHYTDYARCVKAARDGGCLYRMNSFYHNLEANLEFLEAMKQIEKQVKFDYIKAECSIQVLFPLIDIVGRMVNGFTPYTFHSLTNKKHYQPFDIISGSIKDTPIMLLIRNEMNLHQPESNISLLHRIEVGTSRGTLTLTDTHGAVLWTPHLHENLTETNDRNNGQNIPVQETITFDNNYSLGQIFDQLWPKSICKSLEDYYDSIIGSETAHREHQHCLSVCRVWQEIGEMLGPCRSVRVATEEPISIKKID